MLNKRGGKALTSTQRQLINSNTSPDRLGLLTEKAILDFVHSREILHVGQEDIHFNHIVNGGPSGVEDCGEVFEGLFLGSIN
jgi:hypothetical protein